MGPRRLHEQRRNSSIPHTAFAALSADSRGYVFLVADGVGAFSQTSPLRHVLVSALGSSQVDPQILSLELERRDVMLLCTDGLTKHVADEEIRSHLLRPGSSESVCQSLIDLALARGGQDNVTVVMGKARDS